MAEKLSVTKKIYGDEYPINPEVSIFDMLLSSWSTLSIHHTPIDHSIWFGTLLGWYRDMNYIPYDLDIDVMVGREGQHQLLSLVNVL